LQVRHVSFALVAFAKPNNPLWIGVIDVVNERFPRTADLTRPALRLTLAN